MNKEKLAVSLADMRERGKESFSKGLSMWRNSAGSSASSASSSSLATGGAGSVEMTSATGMNYVAASDSSTAAPSSHHHHQQQQQQQQQQHPQQQHKLSYEELVALSVKLTRQNKLMKLQFHKTQTRINELLVKESDLLVMSEFLEKIVGLDLKACVNPLALQQQQQPPLSSSSDQSDQDGASDPDSATDVPARASIDLAQLREMYYVAKEKEKQAAAMVNSSSSSSANGNGNPTDMTSVNLIDFPSPKQAPVPAAPSSKYEEVDLLSDPFGFPPSALPSSGVAPSGFPAFDMLSSAPPLSQTNHNDLLQQEQEKTKQLEQELDQLRRQCKQWEDTAREVEQEKTELASKLTNSLPQLQELQRALDQQTALHAELQEQVASAQQEVESWKQKCHVLDQQQVESTTANAERAVSKLESKLASAEIKVHELECTLKALEGTREELCGALSTSKQEAEEWKQKCEALNQRLASSESALPELESELSSAQSTAKELQSALEMQKTSEKEAQHQISASLEEMNEWKQKCEDLQQQLEAAASAAASAVPEVEARVASAESKSEELVATLKEAEKAKAELVDQVSMVQQEVNDWKQKCETLSRQVESMTATCEGEFPELQSKLSSAETKVAALESALEEQEKRRAELEVQVSNTQQEVDEWKHKCATLSQRIETTECGANTEGYELEKNLLEAEAKVKELEAALQTQKDAQEVLQQQARDALKSETSWKEKVETLEQQLSSTMASSDDVTAEMEAKLADATRSMEEMQASLEEHKEAHLQLEEQVLQSRQFAESWQIKCESLTEELHAIKASPPPPPVDLEAQEALQQESSLLREENTKLRDEIASLEGKQQQDAQASTDAVAVLEQQLEAVKSELTKKELSLSALQDENATIKNAITLYRSKTSGMMEQLDMKLKDMVAANAELQEENQATQAELDSTRHALEETEATKRQIKQDMSKVMEENEYLKSKVELLSQELDKSCQQTEQLRKQLTQKDKDLTDMVASKNTLKEEMIALQDQLADSQGDLQQATQRLEEMANSMREKELLCQESEGKMKNLKLQLDSMRKDHNAELELIRKENEEDLRMLRKEKDSLASLLRQCENENEELQAAKKSLEADLRLETDKGDNLAANVGQLTVKLENLQSELYDARKSVSEKAALASRLQSENMGIAGKQAEQAALIESALREASTSKQALAQMEKEMAKMTNEVESYRQASARATAEMTKLREEMQKQEDQLQESFRAEKDKFEEGLRANKEALRKEIDRIEAESKNKSKLALQVVLEKETEIERLSKRLEELEEDVRSGEADNRKIFEFAQMQAKREAEVRLQAHQMQALHEQLQEKDDMIARLQYENLGHEQELAALMQTQRRDGVNMEYLKNVVVQYMTFRPGSTQQLRLVPVLSTLLQFSANDLREIKKGSRRSSWSWMGEKKEYKTIMHRASIAGEEAHSASATSQIPRVPVSTATSTTTNPVRAHNTELATGSTTDMAIISSGNEQYLSPARASTFEGLEYGDTVNEEDHSSHHGERESADL